MDIRFSVVGCGLIILCSSFCSRFLAPSRQQQKANFNCTVVAVAAAISPIPNHCMHSLLFVLVIYVLVHDTQLNDSTDLKNLICFRGNWKFARVMCARAGVFRLFVFNGLQCLFWSIFSLQFFSALHLLFLANLEPEKTKRNECLGDQIAVPKYNSREYYAKWKCECSIESH